MKWNLLVMGIGLLAMVSCGGSKKEDAKKDKENSKSAADIDIKDLEDACDFADAMLICTQDMKDILDENIDKITEDDLSGDLEKQVNEIQEKMDEIEKAMSDKNIDENDVKKCDAYKEIEEIEKEAEKMIEEQMNKGQATEMKSNEELEREAREGDAPGVE